MSTNEHTPGPWEWEEANHTGLHETSRPRTLVSCSANQFRQSDDENLGRKQVLIPGARMTAQEAGLVDAISLEIRGSKADELLIAAAPELLWIAVEIARLHTVTSSNWPGSAWRDMVGDLANVARDVIAKATG